MTVTTFYVQEIQISAENQGLQKTGSSGEP